MRVQIKTHPNYEVDTAGNVYSLTRPGVRGRKLKPQLHSGGYSAVMLMPGKRWYKVHRLVAEAFVPNPDGKPYVNHIDGVKANNASSNLEWCTHKENVQHAYDTGLAKARRGEKVSTSVLTEAEVKEIKAIYQPRDKVFGARALARKYGLCHTTITRIASGKRWSHVS